MIRRLAQRLHALEARVQPMVLPPFIIETTAEDWPRALAPGERVVVDYSDGGLITWSYRITSDPEDNGLHEGFIGGYITECLQRRATGRPSWPLPWEQEGGPEVVCELPQRLEEPSESEVGSRTQDIIWRPPFWRERASD